MNCGIIYFSATGNTEFIARLFKKELEKLSINCTLIDCTKINRIPDVYDMFVIGSPIHCEVFPDYFEELLLKNLKIGKGRRVIIFGTQVAKSSAGPHYLGEQLKARGFKVVCEANFSLPNNYFVVAFGKTPDDKRVLMIKEATLKVKKIVDCFSRNERFYENTGGLNIIIAKLSYKLFKKHSCNWAKKRLSIDQRLCIKCGKCVQECPTKNINLSDKISFNSKCISCQRCMHNCPVNAFTYKGKHFEQYKKLYPLQ